MIKWIIKRIVVLIWPELRSELGLSKPPKPSKIDKWKAYAEKLALESGIDPENILVHSYGGFGLCGKTFRRNYTTHLPERWGSEVKIPIPLPEKPYIIVPEIVCPWSFRAWIHEIGHFVSKHYQEHIKPVYIREYEAEKYCLDKCKESGVVSDYDMIEIKFSAIDYLDSHIDKAIKLGEIKYKEDIPQEVLDFLFQCDYMREVMDKKNLRSRTDGLQYVRRSAVLS